MSGQEIGLGVLIALVLLALVFDFMNGFHDAANSIATVVSTRVLRPYQAVAWAATFNVLAVLLFEPTIAVTVGTGIVDPEVVDPPVIFGALTAAIAWNILTWWYGMPSSSSHALIGGLVGATVAKSGVDALIGSGVLKVAAFVVLSPLIGFALGAGLLAAIAWCTRGLGVRRLHRAFRQLQLASSALYALGYGTNAAQRAIGIIWLLLIAAGSADATSVPDWVVASCHVVLGLGTLCGGWRIVKTMGQRITALSPVGGCCAETGGAATLFLASQVGIPISTTQTITGAIIGVGAASSSSPVRWSLAGRIVWVWLLTVPAVALLAAVAWAAGRALF